MFETFSDVGVVGRFLSGFGPQKDQNVSLECIYLGDFSPKSFKGVDDSPYGGGPGMVMRADVLELAVKSIFEKYSDYKNQVKVIYTAPRGVVFNNEISKKLAKEFSSGTDYIFICGRYEGIDERFLSQYVDEIYSIGDFVLSGGEVAVMTIIDSFSRFIDGVLGNQESFKDDSFECGLIEGPQYTRPLEFNGEKVPDVLMNGNHKLIEEFRLDKKIEFTKKFRPDLLIKIDKDKK